MAKIMSAIANFHSHSIIRTKDRTVHQGTELASL